MSRESAVLLKGKVSTGWVATLDIFIALGMGLALIIGYLPAQRANPETTSAVQAVVGQLLIWIIFAGVPLFTLAHRKINPVAALGLNRLSASQAPLFTAAGLGAALFVDHICEWIASLFGKGDVEPVVEFLKDPDWSVRIPIYIMAVVIAPIGEELVFRGYLYGVAKRYLGSRWAMIITALLFAWIHQSITSALPVFALACVATIAYEISGSLIVPIVIHAGYNGVMLLFFLK